LIDTRRLSASSEGLNSSLALSAGKLWANAGLKEPNWLKTYPNYDVTHKKPETLNQKSFFIAN